jgi:hypothetical protein
MSVAPEIARSPLPSEVEDRYAGKWIAIRDGDVIAEADDLERLMDDERVRPEDAVYHVPEAGSYFY